MIIGWNIKFRVWLSLSPKESECGFVELACHVPPIFGNELASTVTQYCPAESEENVYLPSTAVMVDFKPLEGQAPLPRSTVAPAIGVSAGFRLPLPFSSRKTLPEIVLFAATTIVAVAVGGTDVAVAVGAIGGIFVTVGEVFVAVGDNVTLGSISVTVAVTSRESSAAASASPTIIVILAESSSPSALETRTLMVYIPASVGVQGW